VQHPYQDDQPGLDRKVEFELDVVVVYIGMEDGLFIGVLMRLGIESSTGYPIEKIVYRDEVSYIYPLCSDCNFDKHFHDPISTKTIQLQWTVLGEYCDVILVKLSISLDDSPTSILLVYKQLETVRSRATPILIFPILRTQRYRLFLVYLPKAFVRQSSSAIVLGPAKTTLALKNLRVPRQDN
jgi:hypothetical protein